MSESPYSPPSVQVARANPAPSERRYGVAVMLAAIFGILGVHHFYLGRIKHGLFDLTLSVIGISLVIFDNWLGFVFIGVDYIHTIIVTFMLLVGSYKDGEGRIIAYPGQFKE